MKHSCEKISVLISEELERELTLVERISMHFHFLMCGACKHYNDNIQKLHRIFKMRLKKKYQTMTLPSEKRDIIKAALRKETLNS